MTAVPSTATLDETETALTLSDGSVHTTILVQKVYVDHWAIGADGFMSTVTLHLALPDMRPWRLVLQEYMRTSRLSEREARRVLRQQDVYLTLWGTKHISLQSYRIRLNEYKSRWKIVGSYDSQHDLYTDKKALPVQRWYLVPKSSMSDKYYVSCSYLGIEKKNTLCTIHFRACASARSYASFPLGRLAEMATVYVKVQEFTKKLCAENSSINQAKEVA